METISSVFALPLLDELTRLQLHVAQRADELMRCGGDHSENRDFWQEAESDIWSRHLSEPVCSTESEMQVPADLHVPSQMAAS